LRIAALEDDPARAIVLERALHPGGHTLARFRSSQPMIEAMRREPFDLLLLDRDVAVPTPTICSIGAAHAGTRDAGDDAGASDAEEGSWRCLRLARMRTCRSPRDAMSCGPASRH
jgi:hypothetical protein